MSKNPHPMRMTLRIWASKIEGDLLTPGDAKIIAKLLRDVASGKDFDQALGVKRPAHRPGTGMTNIYVEQVYGLTQPVISCKDQKESQGMQVSEAIKEVANAFNKSVDTVRTAYYSVEGIKHLEAVKDSLKSPLSEMSRLEKF